ncbi:hypothetical protein L1049_005817 [Liquidambar formosana]|uniref:F-box domain-containing protein n=1 Tax=Liquidambar formosana TaxID=63359 RepID=A0AAP0RGI7_LIQFO
MEKSSWAISKPGTTSIVNQSRFFPVFSKTRGERKSTLEHIHRRHRFSEMKENKHSTVRKWENMPYDILLKIFMTLNIVDMVSGISGVCSSWRSACCDPVLWKTLDLSQLKSDYINIPSEPYAWSDDRSSEKLMQILKNALSLSRGNVTCLIFHFYIYIKDEHLIYTAERCPGLKRLVLPAWTKVTVEGFRKAVQMCKGLESMTVPCISSPSRIMEAISTNCKNFCELKIMCPFDMEFATAITTRLPKLKVLSLRCSMLFKEALVHILNYLEHLEVLNISHCLLLDIPQSPAPSRVFRELDASILEKASRLREFLTCQENSCTMCQYTINDEGILRWHIYEEGLWRMDEVNSLAH